MIRLWYRRPAAHRREIDPTVLIGAHVDLLSAKVEGLTKERAALRHELRAARQQIAELQHALAPYARQELVRCGLNYYLARGRQRAAAEAHRIANEPTVPARAMGRTRRDSPEVWRDAPTEQRRTR